MPQNTNLKKRNAQNVNVGDATSEAPSVKLVPITAQTKNFSSNDLSGLHAVRSHTIPRTTLAIHGLRIPCFTSAPSPPRMRPRYWLQPTPFLLQDKKVTLSTRTLLESLWHSTNEGLSWYTALRQHLTGLYVLESSRICSKLWAIYVLRHNPVTLLLAVLRMQGVYSGCPDGMSRFKISRTHLEFGSVHEWCLDCD